jgi:hypothetical protein
MRLKPRDAAKIKREAEQVAAHVCDQADSLFLSDETVDPDEMDRIVAAIEKVEADRGTN